MMHVDAVSGGRGRSVPHSLGRRLFIFLFALGLLPLLLGGVIAYQRFSHHITAEVVRTTRAMADGAQMSVSEFLAYVRGRTVDIAADWYISDAVERGAPAADLARYLRVQRSLVPESEDVLVLDLRGRVVASSDPDDVGHDYSRASYFTRGLTATTIGDPTFAPGTHRLEWVAASPLRSRQSGRALGVLVNRLIPGELSNVTTGRRSLQRGGPTAPTRPGATGEVYIVDAAGVMITESRFVPDSVLVQRVDTEPVRRARHGAIMVGEYRDYRGVAITGASALLPEQGWTIIAERDASEAFAPLGALRLELLGLGVAVVPAVLCLGFLLHRDLIRPMHRFIAADRRVVEGGPLAGLVPDDSVPWGEWVIVTRVRNQMLQRLHREHVARTAEVDRQQRESERLSSIVRDITLHAPIAATLRAIADAARDLCDAPAATVRLDAAMGDDWPRAVTAAAPDVASDSVIVPEGAAAVVEPIHVRDQVIGTLLVHPRSDGPPRESDRMALRRLARHAAVAIELARYTGEVNSAAERKDRFLATLAHELRSPLSSIIHAVRALDRLGAQNAEAARFRDIAHRQARHIARLISDLLDVARVAAGKLHLERARVELGPIVTEAVEAMRHRERTVEVSLPSAPVVVEGDATRLDQVVRNLLDNAMKYSPPDTSVDVRLATDGGHAIVEVRDHGIGISPEQSARLFEPYMQLESALPRAGGGLGLGLALVHGIVEAHGGTIRITSDGVNCGTSVTVRLPTVA